MIQPQTEAQFYHAEAETAASLASLEDSIHRRRIMESISELYYLLHDKFVELDQPAPPGKFRQ